MYEKKNYSWKFFKFLNGWFKDCYKPSSRQLILHDIHANGILLSESFQIATIIEKLQPSWKDFKNHVKHKHKKIRVEDIISKLRIKRTISCSKKEWALLLYLK